MQTNPQIGDIHYSWTGEEWIPYTIHEITKTGKSFYCHNAERNYGSYMAIPMKDYRPEPVHKQPEPKPAPLLVFFNEILDFRYAKSCAAWTNLYGVKFAFSTEFVKNSKTNRQVFGR